MKQQIKSSEHSPFDVRLLVLRWLISTLAIFAAVWIVPDIHFQGPGWQLGIVAMVFGLFNALLRPLIILLTLFTLGLFGLVINAILLLLSSVFAGYLGISFHVGGFWAAFLGGLIISIVSAILGFLAGDSRIVFSINHADDDDDDDDDDDGNDDNDNDDDDNNRKTIQKFIERTIHKK